MLSATKNKLIVLSLPPAGLPRQGGGTFGGKSASKPASV